MTRSFNGSPRADSIFQGVPKVTAHLQHVLWNAKGRRAVVIVDALRYDCALAIKDLLSGQTVEVEPMLAELPTITPVGMTALLPLSGADISLEIKGNSLHPKVNGKDMSVRENRLALLKTFGADCRDITDVESVTTAPEGLGDLLVVFGHDDVDHIGHGEAETLIRHVKLEIERLARLVRKLHRWGYVRVHIVTDHGFILLDESKLPREVPCEKAWCHVLKERFALVPADADLPLVRSLSPGTERSAWRYRPVWPSSRLKSPSRTGAPRCRNWSFRTSYLAATSSKRSASVSRSCCRRSNCTSRRSR